MSYFASGYRIRILLGALFAAIVADGIITRFLVHKGFAQEGNPFLSQWVGKDAFLAFKLVGGFLVSICLYLIYKRHPKLSIYCSILFLAGYAFIILWNLLIMTK